MASFPSLETIKNTASGRVSNMRGPEFLKSNRWIAKLEPRGACPIGGVFVNHLRLWHWTDDTSYPAQLNDPLPLGFYGRCIFVVSWFNDVSPWTLLPSKKKSSIANWAPYITDSVGKWCLLFSDMTWHLVSRNKLAGKESSHQCVWTKTGFVGWKKGQAACVETHVTEVPAQFHKSASDFETHPKQDTNSISGGWGMGSLIWLVFWSNWSFTSNGCIISTPQIFCRCWLGGISSLPAFNIWVLELEAYNGHTGVMVWNRVEWCTVTPTNWSWNQYKYYNYKYNYNYYNIL